MRAYANIISSDFTASVSVESIGAEVRLIDDTITASAQCRPSVKAMAAVLLGLTLVVASPQSQISVRGCVVEEVGTMPYPWVTNFITADGRFLMTADGKIFFCRED
ncbi:MAG: hypothetical protein ACI3Z0_03260 [Candidatus Cryptobacteroides sp.]